MGAGQSSFSVSVSAGAGAGVSGAGCAGVSLSVPFIRRDSAAPIGQLFQKMQPGFRVVAKVFLIGFYAQKFSGLYFLGDSIPIAVKPRPAISPHPPQPPAATFKLLTSSFCENAFLIEY
jgi:hypothetical protein